MDCWVTIPERVPIKVNSIFFATEAFIRHVKKESFQPVDKEAIAESENHSYAMSTGMGRNVAGLSSPTRKHQDWPIKWSTNSILFFYFFYFLR